MSGAAGRMRGLGDAEATLIPKGGVFTFDPIALRIVEVTPALYRIWGKITDGRPRRLQLPGGALSRMQIAFQAGLAALDLVYLTQLLMEQAERWGQAQLIAGTDYAKMYPSIPRWGVLAVYRRLGVPPGVLRVFSEVLEDRRLRFRTAHGFSEPLEPVAGLATGCCWACLSAVLLVDLPLRQIHSTCRGSQLGPAAPRLPPGGRALPAEAQARLRRTMRLTAAGFVDDVQLWPADLQDLLSMLRCLERFGELTGILTHPGKCWWLWWHAGSLRARVELVYGPPDAVAFRGGVIVECDAFRGLGVLSKRRHPAAQALAVLDALQGRAERLGHLRGVVAEAKSRLALASVVGKLTYAPLVF
eukprot:gene3244-3272_t